LVSEPVAFVAEIVGTLFLALVVFALTDERNLAAPAGRLAPVFIGLNVAILISVIAPLTQACFNPARDFGPRLFAFFAGWGAIAIPGRGTGFLRFISSLPSSGQSWGEACMLACSALICQRKRERTNRLLDCRLPGHDALGMLL
jgi:glycerol uptake facilitator protein